MNKKIKILYVISNLNIGGPQKSLLALLDRIDYEKFEVYIQVLDGKEGKLKKYFNKNVRFLEVNELITAITLPNNRIFWALKIFIKNKKINMFIKSLKVLARHLFMRTTMNIERQNFWEEFRNELPKLSKEFNLAFGILGFSTYYIVDCINSKKKYHWIRSDSRILKRDIEIDKKYFQKVEGALSVSSKCSDIFEDMYPFMKGKIKVFYNYIPISFYKKQELKNEILRKKSNEINLLTVCRLDPLKGIDMAIEACQLLILKGYNIKWYILGDGKEKKKIKKMISLRNIENSFILLGFQLNTFSYIEKTDIFVHPSRTEGKSNAVDEAKYLGKAIVATNYDTVSEQIKNEYNGLICDMNARALANSIERIIKNDELKNKISLNCKKEEDNTINLTNFLKILDREGIENVK